MQVHRKGTDDAIKLRLKLMQKTDWELQQIISRRDPGNTRRYLNDVKTRNAAMVVLRVRSQFQNTVPSVPTPEPPMSENDLQSELRVAEIEQLVDRLEVWCASVELMRNDDQVHPDDPAYHEAIEERTAARAALMDAIKRLAHVEA